MMGDLDGNGVYVIGRCVYLPRFEAVYGSDSGAEG